MMSGYQRSELQRQRAWEMNSLSSSLQLMTTRELFYGENEPTHLLKKFDTQGAAPRRELVLSSMPFYPDWVEPKNEKKENEKDKDVVLWVPICCSECAERITVPVMEMQGVKSVDCNWIKKKVTVSGKGLDPLAIMLKCRDIFCKTQMWNDDL